MTISFHVRKYAKEANFCKVNNHSTSLIGRAGGLAGIRGGKGGRDPFSFNFLSIRVRARRVFMACKTCALARAGGANRVFASPTFVFCCPSAELLRGVNGRSRCRSIQTESGKSELSANASRPEFRSIG